MTILPKQLLAQERQTEFFLCSTGKLVIFHCLGISRGERIETLKHRSESLVQVSRRWDNLLVFR